MRQQAKDVKRKAYEKKSESDGVTARLRRGLSCHCSRRQWGRALSPGVPQLLKTCVSAAPGGRALSPGAPQLLKTCVLAARGGRALSPGAPQLLKTCVLAAPGGLALSPGAPQLLKKVCGRFSAFTRKFMLPHIVRKLCGKAEITRFQNKWLVYISLY